MIHVIETVATLDAQALVVGRSVEALEWFEVFAALRFAIVSVRTSLRGVTYGQMEMPDDLDDFVMFRHLLDQMLDGSYWA